MAALQRRLLTSLRPSSLYRTTVGNRPSRLYAVTVRHNTTLESLNNLANSTSQTSKNDTDPVDILSDLKGNDGATDWSRSYAGLSVQPFPKEVADILQNPIEPLDVEIKPGTPATISHFNDLLIYLKTAFFIYLRLNTEGFSTRPLVPVVGA